MTTFKITDVCESEIVAECESDERLRGFWWSWCPRLARDAIGVYGSTAVEFTESTPRRRRATSHPRTAGSRLV